MHSNDSTTSGSTWLWLIALVMYFLWQHVIAPIGVSALALVREILRAAIVNRRYRASFARDADRREAEQRRLFKPGTRIVDTTIEDIR